MFQDEMRLLSQIIEIWAMYYTYLQLLLIQKKIGLIAIIGKDPKNIFLFNFNMSLSFSITYIGNEV